MTTLLAGLHDREGAHIVPSGGWCVDTIALSESPAPPDYAALAPGVNFIVRMNWGYGSTGTIPTADQHGEMANRAALFVAQSRGCNRWIIANEANHEQEHPRGQTIYPGDYARAYLLCRQAIKRVQPQAEVLIAAVAPWNVQTGDWLAYWEQVFGAIGPGNCDGFTLHSYIHAADPALVNSDQTMDAPFGDRYFQFNAYRNTLSRVPQWARSLPCYLTEANPLSGWQARGVMPAMLDNVQWWNNQRGNQPVQCVCFYRYPDYDMWGMASKPDVLAEFAQAAPRFPAPGATIAVQPEPPTIKLPTVSTGPVAAAGPVATLPARDWDERLTQRGIEIAEAMPEAGALYWRIVRGEYWEEKEHTFAETLDEAGDRMPGVEMIWSWADGVELKVTELRPLDRWMVDFPMYASGRSYGLKAMGHPSDNVFGMGLGSVEAPNMGIHVSYKFVFQLTRAPGVQKPAPPKPPPTITAQTLYVDSPDGLKIRAAPSLNAPQLGGLPHGAQVAVYEVTDGAQPWARVKGGWVAHWLLSETQPQPVTPTVPTEPPAQPQDKWERSYAFTSKWEGGYQNVHNDRGNWTGGQVGVGELKGTNWGISAASYPHLDIKNLTRAQAEEIYKRDYWRASGASDLPWPACLIVFDTSVLHGVGTAKKWLNEAGTNPLHFAARRLRSYVVLDNWHFWGAAWTRRVADLLDEAAK